MTMPKANAEGQGSNAIHSLLTPQNCTVIFIDHQPQMTFGVANIDRQALLNNVMILAKSAKVASLGQLPSLDSLRSGRWLAVADAPGCVSSVLHQRVIPLEKHRSVLQG